MHKAGNFATCRGLRGEATNQTRVLFRNKIPSQCGTNAANSVNQAEKYSPEPTIEMVGVVGDGFSLVVFVIIANRKRGQFIVQSGTIHGRR